MSTMKHSSLSLTMGVVTNFMVLAQSTDHNYVQTTTYLNGSRTDSIVSIQYYDGLGRPDQLVTGGLNTSSTFLHTYTEYDGVGRESKVWAPVIGGTTPDYISASVIPTVSQSTYGDPSGYSQITYDALDRPVAASTPGEVWVEKPKTITYRSNHENEVKRYTMSDMSGSKYYGKCTLFCTESMDEDGHTMQTFRDFMDRIILERRLNGNENIDTYYVYNDICQLVYVLQPMYQTDPDLTKFAFQYTYDKYGRIMSKTIPGCDSIHYEYDQADRIIKMQDGMLREAGKSRVYGYDAIGRLVSQGIEDGEMEIINYYDNYSFLDKHPDLNIESQWDGEVLGLQWYYNNAKYAQGKLTGTWQRASNGSGILTSYVYDEYGRVTKKAEVGLALDAVVHEYSYSFTGDVIEDLFCHYNYDDEMGCLIDDYWGSIRNNYGHRNTKLLSSSVIHLYDRYNGISINDTIHHYQYDHFGRIVKDDRSGYYGDMSYEYDNLHGWLTGIKAKSNFEQRLYRETGGETPRWNGSISAMTWTNYDKQPRRYDYTYDEMDRLINARYSEPTDVANCAQLRRTNWDEDDTNVIGYIPSSTLAAGDNKYGESITYDANSSITSLVRHGMLNDKSYGIIDDLSIDYNGNQRTRVTDYATEMLTYSGASDFMDGNKSGNDYQYNENGALIMDRNKGITNIEYDLLGHPRRITFTTGNSIEYVYAADGRKLRVTHNEKKSGRTVTNVKDYNDMFVFSNGYLSSVEFDGGFYDYDWIDYDYDLCFHVKDYLGNICQTVSDDCDFVYPVFQRKHYYPYGGLIGGISNAIGGKSFCSKELDHSYGLDLYDFEARMYDGLVPTFDRPDQLAGDYTWLSPYAYCAGNPVNCVDPDGKAIIFVNGFRPSAGARDMCTSPLGNSGSNSIYETDVFKYWDKSIVRYYTDKNQYNDENISFTSGSSFADSDVSMRENEGAAKAMIFHNQVADGKITLNGDEPIRLISHSQGGATAAGMAAKLQELGYNVEVIEYITPHQAKDIHHPEGVKGIQFDQTHDRVVSGKGKINGVDARFEDSSHQTSLLGGHSNSDNLEVIKRAKHLRMQGQ